MFQEYPKSLYMDGDCEKEHVIVRDADEEAGKRAEGFMMFAEAYEADQREPQHETVESVRAKLDAAGIAYDGRWGVHKLVALLPKV